MHNRKTYMYMHISFKPNGVISRSFKTVITNVFAINRKLHNFATCNSNFEKSQLSDMHYPISDIQVEFEDNRPIRYQITAKRNCFYRRQTDVRRDIAFVNNR